MQTDLPAIESALAEHRVNLNTWLDTIYDQPHADREYSGELDCSYDYWDHIESTVGDLFDSRLTQNLSPASLHSLLFFASRNEECGRIIAWLGRIGAFSNVGDLSGADFMFLCHSALSRPEDFVDYELVACFHKIPTLTEQQTETVRRFFDRDFAYTKRMAIDVLAAKGFDGIPDLAQQLWSHDNCEFTKLSALHALKQSGSSSLLAEMISQFKSLFDVDAHDYLQSHMQQLET